MITGLSNNNLNTHKKCNTCILEIQMCGDVDVLVTISFEFLNIGHVYSGIYLLINTSDNNLSASIFQSLY